MVVDTEQRLMMPRSGVTVYSIGAVKSRVTLAQELVSGISATNEHNIKTYKCGYFGI